MRSRTEADLDYQQKTINKLDARIKRENDAQKDLVNKLSTQLGKLKDKMTKYEKAAVK